ncbi:hypothetical protein RINTHM_1130 [Richelia intracellularis HM01]|nr:hypothetical protein RINTHM_1130 [Richelia intracellularis HM01]
MANFLLNLAPGILPRIQMGVIDSLTKAPICNANCMLP